MWEKRFIDPARGLFELTHRASLVAYTINILAERNLLISLVNKLEILEVENRLNSNIKRACQNLLTHGCINMGAYNKLLQGMHSADAKPTPLAESIANKINDLEEQGFLYLLVNENQLEKMCQLDSEINVDLFFNQLTDHLTRSPFSLKK